MGIAMVILVLLLAATITIAIVTIKWVKYQLNHIQHLQAYSAFHDLKVEEARTKNNLHILRKRIAEETQEHESAMASLTQEYVQKKKLIEEATLDADVIEAGFYHTDFNFIDSNEYKERLSKCRDVQKHLIKTKQAAFCTRSWIIDGSLEAGALMVKELLNLMLRAFNGECDSFVSRVTYKNGVAMEEKIRTSFREINSLGKDRQCFLSEELLRQKLAEIALVFGFNEKREQEKQEQREIKDQMKEEERAQKEIDKARIDAEKEEQRISDALEKARKEVALKSDSQREALENKIRLLEQQLATASENKARAISMAQLTRSGHVYIISNIGSFGEDVFKIGLTRRMEPLDRVKELGDASVPFEFDVHAMAFSTDAPALEKQLHEAFASYRVNKLNDRKEFFRVPLTMIAQELKKRASDVRVTMLAEAREYRESAQIAGRSDVSQGHSL